MRLISCLFFCLLLQVGFAQEQLGLRTENYSGINGILLNPANNLTTPFQWDINLIAPGQFVATNFGAFQNTGIFSLINNASEVILATDLNEGASPPRDAIIFDFEGIGKNKYAAVFTHVMGPSALLNFEKHSIGLFTNARVAIGGQKIPTVLGYYDYQAVRPGEDFKVFPSQIAGMAWSEIGLNYLFKAETTNGKVGIGVNLKYLQGYESFYIQNKRGLDITKMQLDSLTFNNGAAMGFGFTNTTVDADNYSLSKNGVGFGIDAGLTYVIQDYSDVYRLKLGISLLDIGKIKFNKNTEDHLIDIEEAFDFFPRNLDDVVDFRDGLEQLNEELFLDTTTTLVGDSYSVWLPGALSLQADYAVTENIYINAVLVQRLTFGQPQVERGNLLAFTPRYESRWISGFLPVSVYNYQKVQVGAAIRLAFLTIGSDDLLSFFGKSKLNGTDFYIALKINPFQLGWKNGGMGKGKGVKCYEF